MKYHIFDKILAKLPFSFISLPQSSKLFEHNDPEIRNRVCTSQEQVSTMLTVMPFWLDYYFKLCF